jgi:EthD domain
MIKLMTLVGSGAGISSEKFARHWRDVYLAEFTALRCVGIRLLKAVHNHVLPTDIRGGEGLPGHAWAGISCYYFDDRSSVDALLGDPSLEALLRAHSGIIARTSNLVVDEILIFDRDPSLLPVKMFAFFKRRPQMSRLEALRYYRTIHADVGASINRDRISRYVQNHVVEGYHNADSACDYDGGPETWFKTLEIATNLFNDREAMETIGKDEENFVIRDELLHFLTDEKVIFDRQPTAT